MLSFTLSTGKWRSAFLIAFSFGVSCVLLALTANAQEKAADSLVAKLAEVCRKHDVPAMTAAVVDANGLVKSQCSGVRKRGTSDEVELSDRFPLGSCTKSMTATLAAVMVDAGKIEWETTIGDVWPKATDEHIHPDLRKVTLEHFHFSCRPGPVLADAAPGQVLAYK